VSAGEALRLDCPVDNSAAVGRGAAPIITWYKDGDEVSVGWERYRVVRHDALYVRDVEPRDSGVFVCRATNGFGSVDVKYLVLVQPGQSRSRSRRHRPLDACSARLPFCPQHSSHVFKDFVLQPSRPKPT